MPGVRRVMWIASVVLLAALLWPAAAMVTGAETSAEDADEPAPAATDAPETDVPAPEPSLLARSQARAAHEALVGSWRATIGREQVRLYLQYDGRFTLNGREGEYRRHHNTLELRFDPPPGEPDGAGAERRTLTYNYRFVNRQLELAGGDLEGPVVFIRQFGLSIYLAELFETDVEDIWQRVNRIGFIAIVVLAAHGLIVLLRLASHTLIFSSWGPLGMAYRHRKNRAKTIHSIVLNLVKYFVYFTALGMIMAEMGVNYMTYIASLSVIGLAVGFGSQGLVQDMVTGFFIIFEGQFDVGDMVEISGQSGYVVDLGLRMTKLRNYFGQIVVIPNRNIALVGNYSRGAQRAYVDVQVPSTDAGLNAMPVMRELGHELAKQFEGVVLGPVKVTGPRSLATGEHFVRLHVSIWPNQLWVVNEQLVPRLREAMRRAEIEIVSDRVSAFYHARETVDLPNWLGRLSRRARRAAKPGAPEPDVGAGV